MKNDMKLGDVRMKAVSIGITNIGIINGAFHNKSAGLRLYIGSQDDDPSDLVDSSCIMSSLDISSKSAKVVVVDKPNAIIGYLSICDNTVNVFISHENVYLYVETIICKNDGSLRVYNFN